MFPFPARETFYAFVNGGEFVEWMMMQDDTLAITTLWGHSLYFARSAWTYRKTFFGEGKFDLQFQHQGLDFSVSLRILPVSERDGNMRLFMSGLNGPLNTRRFPLSEIFGRDRVSFSFGE